MLVFISEASGQSLRVMPQNGDVKDGDVNGRGKEGTLGMMVCSGLAGCYIDIACILHGVLCILYIIRVHLHCGHASIYIY